jgi:hypothetical protein
MVEVLPVVAPGTTVTAVPLTANLELTGLTETETAAEANGV